MKPYVYFLLAASLACGRGVATGAEPPAPVVPRCGISLGSGPVVDYGRIKRSQLRSDAAVALPMRQSSLSVACNQSFMMALRIAGEGAPKEPGAAAQLGVVPQALHGIGQTVAGKSLGAFALRLRRDTATVDGKPATLIISSDGGATWREAEADAAARDDEIVAWAMPGERKPASGRMLQVGLRLDACIAATSSWVLNREAMLDGRINLTTIHL